MPFVRIQPNAGTTVTTINIDTSKSGSLHYAPNNGQAGLDASGGNSDPSGNPITSLRVQAVDDNAVVTLMNLTVTWHYRRYSG